MKPVSVTLPFAPVALAAHAGGYAALGPDGITLLDPELAPTTFIKGAAPRCERLTLLLDGRWLAHQRGFFTKLYAGVPGGPLEPIYEGELFGDQPIVTWTGFVANYDGQLYVDEGGRGRRLTHGVKGHSVGSTDDRLVLCGDRGLAVVDLAGRVVAQVSEPTHAEVLWIRNGQMLLRCFHRLEVRELETLACVRTIETDLGQAAIRGNDVIVQTEGSLTCWDVVRGTKRWTRAIERERLVGVVGDRIITDAIEAVQIFDAAGKRLDELALGSRVWRAEPMGKGCALVTNHDAVVWWRGAGDTRVLHHDLGATGALSVPAGLLTAEARVLHLWGTSDADVPDDESKVATAIPVDTWIVSRGVEMKTTALGRYRVLAEVHGRRVGIDAEAPFRLTTSSAEARVIVDALVAKDLSGTLPTLQSDETAADVAQRPPTSTASLHAHALFAPRALSRQAQTLAANARQAFFAELARALGVPWRPLLAGVRAGRVPFTAPRELAPAYEYLGSFESSGKLSVCDPCQRGRTGRLVLGLAGATGAFHVFVRSALSQPDRNAELLAVHEHGFDARADERCGSIAVDTGLAGVFDARCPKIDLDAPPFEDGIHHGLSGIARSGDGDGGYPVYVARASGKTVKIRVAFFDEAHEDRAVLAPRRGGRKYAPTERFAVGEPIEHGKFGPGLVTELTTDGKIVVAFADVARSLIHGRPSK